MTGVDVIYADWPSRPFGVTWHRLADALHDAGLTAALRDAGHSVEDVVLRAEGPDASDVRGGMRLAGDVAKRIRVARDNGRLTVVVCGSCSVAAVAAAAALGPEKLGIACFDAHPDLNTPDTSQSDLIEGMALAMALGRCWQAMTTAQAGLEAARNPTVAFVGARDIDPPEQALIDTQNWPIFAAGDKVIQHFANSKSVYVHLDMDVHDALSVRTNAFAVTNGPDVHMVRAALAALAAKAPLACLAVTGLDPAAADADKAIAIAIDHVRAVAGAWEQSHA